MNQGIKNNIIKIIEKYQTSFKDKSYNEENNDCDILMNVFGITPELKRENRQYWGRELGMCWQLLIVELAKGSCSNFSPAFKIGSDEPVDLLIGKEAIDTKYRLGSGDSGTLKKFKSYGKLLVEQGYTPVMLLLRKDNLPAAITSLKVGGWKVYTGDESFDYIFQKTGIDFKDLLYSIDSNYLIN